MEFWSLSNDENSLGSVSPISPIAYDEVYQLQLQLVELRHKNLIPDVILFLEHQPVITRGRGLQWTGKVQVRQMPAPAHLPASIVFREIERGGDLTYHGPGQLVIYPIVKLDGKGLGVLHDVGGFLRQFEGVLIDELQAQGLPAGRREQATGVWIGEKKVASIGIAIRKWVTFHGAALNVVNDLSPFHLMSPCGMSPDMMTRLIDWPASEVSKKNTVTNGVVNETWTHREWRSSLEHALATRFLALEMPGNLGGTVQIRQFTCNAIQARIREILLLESEGSTLKI
jgi:lipoate-protein ligase B